MIISKLSYHLIVFTALAVFLIGCGDLGDDPVTSTPAPTDTTTWSDVSSLLSSNCSICHGADNSSQYFNANSYTSVVNHLTLASNPLVSPGNSNASELIWRLEGSNGMPLMPQGGPALSETDIDLIKQWIDDGALE